jgi:hypothetical protein
MPLRVELSQGVAMPVSRSFFEELEALAVEIRRIAASIDDPTIARRLIEMADETLALVGSSIAE